MIREHYQIFAPIEDLGRRPSLPAVLGAISIAIGLALQGTLSNLAAGQ